MHETVVLIFVLICVLAAEFVNGWNDAPNAIATVISTRVMSPMRALVMAAVLNVLGAALSGSAVASTIGKAIVQPEAINLSVVVAAVLSIAIWGAIATLYGLPISISHGLVSGLAGAGVVTAGTGVLLWEGWRKVIVGLGFSTLLGFMVAFIFMTVLYWVLRWVSPFRVRSIFGKISLQK